MGSAPEKTIEQYAEEKVAARTEQVRKEIEELTGKPEEKPAEEPKPEAATPEKPEVP